MRAAWGSKEEAWLERARAGESEAFSQLVEAFQVPVYNLCLRMLGVPAEAEDAAQETFLKAYRHLDRYDPQRPFPTWLLAIASHHCIDQMRRRRLATFSLDTLLPSQERPDPAPGPEEALALRERQEMLEALARDLGPKDRAAIVLHYWYDLSYEEIAQALALSVGAVKSRMHRARRSLASQWIEHDPERMTARGTGHEPSAI